MECWQYQVVRFGSGDFLGGRIDADQLEAKLNFLGRSGWELVSIIDSIAPRDQSLEIVVTFKRKKLEVPHESDEILAFAAY